MSDQTSQDTKQTDAKNRPLTEQEASEVAGGGGMGQEQHESQENKPSTRSIMSDVRSMSR